MSMAIELSDLIESYQDYILGFIVKNDRDNENLLEKFIQDFTTIIIENPNSYDPYYWRGLCYMELKKDDEAIENFNKALEIIPDDEYCLTMIETIKKRQSEQG